MKTRNKEQKMYMGIDQFGNTYHNLGPYPRKELLKRLAATKAHKMYKGQGVHIGYVIKECWIRLYEVIPYRR